MQTTRRYHCLVARLAVFVVAWWLAGCSSIPPDVVPVRGRVTQGGKPLAGATVTFQPVRTGSEDAVGVTGSAGRTDAEGRFSLRLIEPDVPGATKGKHVVTITSATVVERDDAARPTGERVPARWRDGSQTFEVPAGGTEQANFDL